MHALKLFGLACALAAGAFALALFKDPPTSAASDRMQSRPSADGQSRAATPTYDSFAVDE